MKKTKFGNILYWYHIQYDMISDIVSSHISLVFMKLLSFLILTISHSIYVEQILKTKESRIHNFTFSIKIEK